MRTFLLNSITTRCDFEPPSTIEGAVAHVLHTQRRRSLELRAGDQRPSGSARSRVHPGLFRPLCDRALPAPHDIQAVSVHRDAVRREHAALHLPACRAVGVANQASLQNPRLDAVDDTLPAAEVLDPAVGHKHNARCEADQFGLVGVGQQPCELLGRRLEVLVQRRMFEGREHSLKAARTWISSRRVSTLRSCGVEVHDRAPVGVALDLDLDAHALKELRRPCESASS